MIYLVGVGVAGKKYYLGHYYIFMIEHVASPPGLKWFTCDNNKDF